MKISVFFCCMLFLITSCGFTLLAESKLGEVIGLIALVISIAVSLKMSFEKEYQGK